MRTRAYSHRGFRPLLLVMTLLFGALFVAGLAVAQATSLGTPSEYGSTHAPVATPPGCLPGWRIIDSPSPNPQYSELYKVDGSADTDMWAVGSSSGTALIEHWDGVSWSVVPTPTTTYARSALHDVVALSANDAWAVGYYEGSTTSDYTAAILHWDGAMWSSIPAPQALQGYPTRLSSVDGVSANDVWAVGWWRIDGPYQIRALILHWDGATWSVVSNPAGTASALNSVTAIASNDVWTVGGAGSSLLMHWDGAQWSISPTSAMKDMYEVAAVASNDVWAVGSSYSAGHEVAQILHWDGTSWTESLTRKDLRLSGITSLSSTDVWAVGTQVLHWDGVQWNTIGSYGGDFFGVTAASPGKMWTVGRRSIGDDLQTMTMLYIASCPAITPTPTGCNTGWTALNSPNLGAEGNTMRGVEAISPSDVWAVGSGVQGGEFQPMSMHWDGHAWSIVPMPSPVGGGILRAVSAVATDDVWAVGDIPQARSQLLIMHWNGNVWSIVPGPNIGGSSNHLADVVAIAANDVWAVNYPDGSGLAYFAIHWDGSTWSMVSVPFGSQLNAVSATASNDVWAVGRGTSGPLTLHWNGNAWSSVPSPMITGSDTLFGVSAISGNDVWAVGQMGYTRAAIHWDGANWSSVEIPGGIVGDILAVSAYSANDVWAVGETYTGSTYHTLIIHWDGSQWVQVPSPNPDSSYNELFAVEAVSPNEVWSVGHQGAINNGGVFTLVERYVGSCATSTVTATATAATTATLPASATNTPIAATSTTSMPSATSTPIASQTPVASTTATATVPPESTATPALTPCPIIFSDVPTDNTFYSYIRCLACRGLASGYADGTFRPDNEVTRGQLSKLVANAAGLSATPTGQTFEDVPASHTFYLYIERMANSDVLGGYPCGSVPQEPCLAPDDRPYFRPGANATRGQIAKIISNAAGFDDMPTQQTFEDVAPDSPFYLWVERLAGRGVMGGYACGGEGEPCGTNNKPYFRPNANATRGQVAKIVVNTFLPGCQTP